VKCRKHLLSAESILYRNESTALEALEIKVTTSILNSLSIQLFNLPNSHLFFQISLSNSTFQSSQLSFTLSFIFPN